MGNKREEYVGRLLDEALGSNATEQRIPFAKPGDKLRPSQALERLIEKIETPDKPKRASSLERNKVRDEIAAAAAIEPRLKTTMYGMDTGVSLESPEDAIERMTDEQMAQRGKMDRALVTYGDKVLLEKPEHWSVGGAARGAGNLALEGINRFGEASLAMPPSLGPPGAVIHGLGQAIKFPSSTLKHMAGRKPPQAMSYADETLGREQQSYDRVLALMRSIDPNYRPPPSLGTKGAPTTYTDKMKAADDIWRDNVKVTGDYQRRRDSIPPMPPGSVPRAGNWQASREVLSAADDVASRPYWQAVGGRQGLTSPNDVAAMMRRGVDEGRTFGDMGRPGPWGRDMLGARREFTAREVAIELSGRIQELENRLRGTDPTNAGPLTEELDRLRAILARLMGPGGGSGE